MVHQLLALTLQFGAISAERCWEQLSTITDFSGITATEFNILIAHMLKEGFLYESGGLLSMGDKAEKVFGRKNFMELYAVFSSPVLYKVQTKAGYLIGSLEQAFVDKLVEEISSFLLGGRAWTVRHVNHSDRTIQVEPAPRGKKPSWGGFIPQLLGYEICQQIADVLKGSEALPYVDEQTQISLDASREDLGTQLNKLEGQYIQYESDRAIWWTFAGGQINHTLKYGLQYGHDWKIVADNFRLKIEGDSVGPSTVNLSLKAIRDQSFWDDPSIQSFILSELPEYRLSKFQTALPDIFSLELIKNYLLDVPAALTFLKEG
jgi:ATP-dependent helicase Lhr and Lhr-like helicase